MKNELGQIFKLLAKLCIKVLENEKKSSESEDEVYELDMKDEEDSDYEIDYKPSDTLYSYLNDVHELYYVKVRLGELGKKDIGLYKQLEQGLSEDEFKNFHKAMAEADNLQKEINEDTN